jgi:hypothetical protein
MIYSNIRIIIFKVIFHFMVFYGGNKWMSGKFKSAGGGGGIGYNSDGGGSAINKDNNAAAETNIERLGSELINNWSSLSTDNQNSVNAALFTIYRNGGNAVIDFLTDGNYKFNLDLNNSANLLANMWNQYCRNIGYFLAGLGKNVWKWGNESEKTCDNPNFITNTIYLAKELFSKTPIPGYDFWLYKPGWFFGWFGEWAIKYQDLFMVFAHEIKHFYDSITTELPFDKEQSANKFMIDIWNNFNNPWIYKGKRR